MWGRSGTIGYEQISGLHKLLNKGDLNAALTKIELAILSNPSDEKLRKNKALILQEINADEEVSPTN